MLEKKELSPREMRLEMAKRSKKLDPVEEDRKNREEFRKFFTQLKRKKSLSADLENIIWLHFKSSGYDKAEKFEEGIKHFGYKD